MKFRKLEANEIDVRVATVTEKGCSLLLYKDARVDQNILDETVGPEYWQRTHQLIGGNLYCTVEIYIKELGAWVGKQDVGTESYTEKEKGQASDSFKRACFNWGIGRELYTAPFIWINKGDCQISEQGGKVTTKDRFEVKTIGYDDCGNINQLEIVNTKMKKVVFKMGGNAYAEETSEYITKKEQEILKNMVRKRGLSLESCLNGKPLEKVTPAAYQDAVKRLSKLPEVTE